MGAMWLIWLVEGALHMERFGRGSLRIGGPLEKVRQRTGSSWVRTRPPAGQMGWIGWEKGFVRGCVSSGLNMERLENVNRSIIESTTEYGRCRNYFEWSIVPTP